ncbi:hypothetical protein C9374_002223 [Naegleria lovaniensis]|uniref:Uncharacterized protein n=1 Tax=Naegleria lovaniensis TaxID=51637 RepID=A0AA88GVH5_NAELO|nr:uncharacterized protein C9374_002223 [Naegleria lovaniensis]KAG2386479.1 hypothetical protein C9374_002223 [Naegleria lovaniensis]
MMKSKNASSSSSQNTSNATPANPICCIDGCSRQSSIRNFSCLQGVWQVKLEHANSPNIEGLKICTTHYNEDLRQHPRVAGQGNNHHTTRKDKLRKQRLQEERKRLEQSLKNKDSLGTPDSDQQNNLLISNSSSNNNSSDAFHTLNISSSNSSSNQHLSQSSQHHLLRSHVQLQPRRGYKRKTIESETKSPSNSSVSSLSSDDEDSDTCINSSMVVVAHEGTSPLRPYSSDENVNTISSQKKQERSASLLSVDEQLPASSISINKRKRYSNSRKSISKNQSAMTEEEDSEYVLMDTKQILSIIENQSGVANFVPHVSMVYNLNNSFSFKYDLTLFREMIRLRPLNNYYLNFEDNSRVYVLRMIHPSTATNASSSTSTTSQRHVSNVLFSLCEQHQTTSSTAQKTTSDEQQPSNDGNANTELILENNIEWLELQWGLSSLKVREREIEIRCFQFFKYS